ncbi:MAG: hypothetical protein AAGC74_03900 [Verrucomicrobiota bacterium]
MSQKGNLRFRRKEWGRKGLVETDNLEDKNINDSEIIAVKVGKPRLGKFVSSMKFKKLSNAEKTGRRDLRLRKENQTLQDSLANQRTLTAREFLEQTPDQFIEVESKGSSEE